MFDLNLLPNKEKNILKRERLYQFISITLVVFLIGISLVSLELFWAKDLLKKNFPSYDLSLNKNKEMIEKIKDINWKLQTVDKIQNNYLETSPILIALSQVSSDNIQIKYFNLNYDKKDFKIQGWSKNRDVLLKFQTDLENLDFFIEVQSPLSNLLKQENINFEFTGKIK